MKIIYVHTRFFTRLIESIRWFFFKFLKSKHIDFRMDTNDTTKFVIVKELFFVAIR